jgi:hypothetical protein
MEVHMECTVLTLLMDSGRIAGAFGYDREKGHGFMLPFQIPVSMGQTVTISWDNESSRYIVESMGRKTAA